MKGRINAVTPAQIAFRDWMDARGTSVPYGFGTLRVDQPRRHVSAVGANSIESAE